MKKAIFLFNMILLITITLAIIFAPTYVSNKIVNLAVYIGNDGDAGDMVDGVKLERFSNEYGHFTAHYIFDKSQDDVRDLAKSYGTSQQALIKEIELKVRVKVNLTYCSTGYKYLIAYGFKVKNIAYYNNNTEMFSIELSSCEKD